MTESGLVADNVQALPVILQSTQKVAAAWVVSLHTQTAAGCQNTPGPCVQGSRSPVR